MLENRWMQCRRLVLLARTVCIRVPVGSEVVVEGVIVSGWTQWYNWVTPARSLYRK